MRYWERFIAPLFLSAAVISLVYWYWTTTPSYALNQVLLAIKNQDIVAFEKYVDLDSLSYSAIDDVLNRVARETKFFKNTDNRIGLGIISLFKPEIADIIKSQIVRLISDGTLKPAISKPPFVAKSALDAPYAAASTITSQVRQNQSDVPAKSFFAVSRHSKIKQLLKDYGLSRDTFKGIGYFKIEGPIAFLGLTFYSPKFSKNFIVEFKLEDYGGYWRVTELSNLPHLVNTYFEQKAVKHS